VIALPDGLARSFCQQFAFMISALLDGLVRSFCQRFAFFSCHFLSQMSALLGGLARSFCHRCFSYFFGWRGQTRFAFVSFSQTVTGWTL